MSFCLEYGCSFYGSRDFNGLCSGCYKKDKPIPFQFGEPPTELMQILFSSDLSSDDEQPIREFSWQNSPLKVIDVFNSASQIQSGKVRLSALKVVIKTLPEGYDPRWGILSYKWDITNKIDEHLYLNQESGTLALGLSKALSVDIDYLLVDAICVPQYGERPMDIFYHYSKLYETMRVVSTFTITTTILDDKSATSHFVYELCQTYPIRTWILFEASRYLRNEHACLRDLISILDSDGNDITNHIDEDRLVDYDNRGYYELAARCFLSSIVHPFTAGKYASSEDAQFYEACILNISRDRYRGGYWSRVIQTTKQLYCTEVISILPLFVYGVFDVEIQVKFAYVMQILKSLCNEDLLKSFISSFTDVFMILLEDVIPLQFVKVILNLVSRTKQYQRHIALVTVHLLFSRQVEYALQNDMDGQFLLELMELFDVAGFPKVKDLRKTIYFLSNKMKWSMEPEPPGKGRIYFPDKILGKTNICCSLEDDMDDEAMPGRKICILRIKKILVAVTAAAMKLEENN